jgi:Ca2+-binding RTX toxin-like protein
MIRVRTIFVAVTTATMLGGSGFMLFLATTSGAAKDCTITGTAANDNITGTTRDDVICLRAGSDTANGLEGDDVIRVAREMTDPTSRSRRPLLPTSVPSEASRAVTAPT